MMVSSLPGRTKEYPDIGIAMEKCLRFVPTRPNQLLLAKMNLGSNRGPRQGRISRRGGRRVVQVIGRI